MHFCHSKPFPRRGFHYEQCTDYVFFSRSRVVFVHTASPLPHSHKNKRFLFFYIQPDLDVLEPQIAVTNPDWGNPDTGTVGTIQISLESNHFRAVCIDNPEFLCVLFLVLK
jgi:hypothetical protein